MLVREISTGKHISAVIERMTMKDFKTVAKSKVRFPCFNWQFHKNDEVYKLRLNSDQLILGIMCMLDHAAGAINALEIRLLEVSRENWGAEKQIEDIAGCLFAFACSESFKRGHDGCVFLLPKSKLIEHYKKKYGFWHIPIRSAAAPDGTMILDQLGAQKIISRYFDAA